MLTLGDALRANALKRPSSLCLADETRRLSFAEVNARVNRLAHGLSALGCRPGDAVAVYARNSIEYLELFHACAKLGVRLVTLNFWLRPSELEVLLDHSEAGWLFVGESSQEGVAAVRPRLAALRPNGFIVIGRARVPDALSLEDVLAQGREDEPGLRVDPQAPFWMMYTSGTTGDPKGLVRSFLRTALCLWAGTIEFGYRPDDVFLAVSPFFHGVTFLPLMVLEIGGCVHVMPEFDAGRALDLIERERITAGFVVPTVLTLLMDHPRFEHTRFDALRVLVTGGAALPTIVKERAMRVMGPVLHEFYGASESGFITVLHPRDQLRKERCCGQPAFGAEVEIRDPSGAVLPPDAIGEIFTRCEGRFDGYYKDHARTADVLREGWFTAGDLGRMDAEGFVYIVDRKTDMIISGGENVYPREIEDVLRHHPAIQECAVIGIPDPLWGEAVKAVIVLRPGHSLTAEGVLAHCGPRLAGFKQPKHVEFAPELPRTHPERS